MSEVLELLRVRRSNNLVPPSELVICDYCGARIPSTKQRRKQDKHHFCNTREHGLWMRGRSRNHD